MARTMAQGASLKQILQQCSSLGWRQQDIGMLRGHFLVYVGESRCCFGPKYRDSSTEFWFVQVEISAKPAGIRFPSFSLCIERENWILANFLQISPNFPKFCKKTAGSAPSDFFPPAEIFNIVLYTTLMFLRSDCKFLYH
jgi:hypothetical protein